MRGWRAVALGLVGSALFFTLFRRVAHRDDLVAAKSTPGSDRTGLDLACCLLVHPRFVLGLALLLLTLFLPPCSVSDCQYCSIKECLWNIVFHRSVFSCVPRDVLHASCGNSINHANRPPHPPSRATASRTSLLDRLQQLEDGVTATRDAANLHIQASSPHTEGDTSTGLRTTSSTGHAKRNEALINELQARAEQAESALEMAQIEAARVQAELQKLKRKASASLSDMHSPDEASVRPEGKSNHP